QRLANWSGDVEKLQHGLAYELARIAQRQRQRMVEIEARIGQDAEGLQATIDEQRLLVARLREDLERAATEVLQSATAELEQHAAERRRALNELAERLSRREHELNELIEREQADVMQRVQATLGDSERRQVQQLERAV